MAPETPRAVSSRLLTMKFMQRAAATGSASSSPDNNTPSAKKRKFDHSPASGRIDLNIDQASIKAALEDQEAKRQAALRKHTLVDTHWVLNSTAKASSAKPTANPPLNIVYVGYGDVDSDNESGDDGDEPAQGRTSTKNYNKTAQATSSKREDDGEDESGEGSSSEAEDATPGRKSERRSAQDSSGTKRARSRSQSRPAAESSKAKEMRDKRRKKEVHLSKITSISSAGGSPLSSQANKSMKCYNCHQVGHRASDCPKK